MPAPTRFWEAKPGRTFVGRLATGSDLVEEIERTCADRGISAGEVTVVGAVRTAAYAFYEQSPMRRAGRSAGTCCEGRRSSSQK
jgi:predicted DNA-binding protein with PD1-like motif